MHVLLEFSVSGQELYEHLLELIIKEASLQPKCFVGLIALLGQLYIVTLLQFFIILTQFALLNPCLIKFIKQVLAIRIVHEVVCGHVLVGFHLHRQIDHTIAKVVQSDIFFGNCSGQVWQHLRHRE